MLEQLSNIHFGVQSYDSFHETIEVNKSAILCDSLTFEHCLPTLISEFPKLENVPVFVMPEGEANKNLDQVSKIYEELLNLNLGRNAVLINLGGGVVTDLGGFVASTFKRGIDYINIPTTLMGMVDASIGGKTAVNVQQFRNIAGVFAHPKSVFIFPQFLKTLSPVEIQSGWAEMMKHALLTSEQAWEAFQQYDTRQIPPDDLIEANARFKESVVNSDFKDQNHRQILNLGHTTAHALETWNLQQNREIPHGFAVAAGIFIEAELAMRIGTGLSSGECREIQQFISAQFPKLKFDENAVDEIIALMRNDKKNKQQITFSLLESVGLALIGIEPDEMYIRDSILHYLHA
jgi:3-dehydroquinate synthase